MRLVSRLEVVLVGLGIVLGSVIGLALGLLSQFAWRPLGRPPAPAERIWMATAASVVVQGADGNLYAFTDEDQTYWRGGQPRGQWTTQLPAVQAWETAECGPNMRVPAVEPARAIRGQLNCWVAVEHAQIGMAYAVFGDGSVWRWSTPRPIERTALPFSLSALGALLGLGLGWGVINLIWRLQERRHGRAFAETPGSGGPRITPGV